MKSESHDAGTALPRIDRRVPPRADIGTCARCKTSDSVAVVSRTDYVLYARCAACGTVWSVPKPAKSRQLRDA
jgi:hypothetical protein